FRLRLQYAASDLRRHPRAAGDRAAVRFPMDQSRLLLQSVPAQRELLRRFRTLRLPSPGGSERTGAAGALSRCGAPRRARRHLVAAGHRRLGPRPLDAAGYELKGTTLRARASGRPFAFEIMVTDRDDERLGLAFSAMLARAGIALQVRLVDAVQYQERLSSFD